VPRPRSSTLVFAYAVMSFATHCGAQAAASAGPAPRAAILLASSPRSAVKGKPFVARIAEARGLTAFGFVSAIQGPYNPIATGGNAHFTRSVLRAGGLDQLAQVAQRRFELSYSSLGRGLIGPLVVFAAIAVLLGIRHRERLMARLEGLPTMRPGSTAHWSQRSAGRSLTTPAQSSF